MHKFSMKNNGRMNSLLLNFLVIGVLVFSFYLINFQKVIFAQETFETHPPKTLEKTKEEGKKFFEAAKKELPGILEKIWREEVLPVWQKMWHFFKNLWDTYIASQIKNVEKKIFSLIEEELKKKKQEIKNQVISRWERVKELIR